MAIHCHSARYHYDSFHSRGGDIINIGSNNTYNIGGYGFGSSIWGNGGSFWGGFGTSLGLGLGQGLMNWLGNGLNGGGWNPAGIFGGTGFGNSMGFGMNPWSSFGWGGSVGRGGSASGADSSGKTKEVVKDDPDCQKIADITGKIKDLKADATADDIKKIIKDIDDVVLDKNNEPAQKRTLENLKTQLQNRLASIENTTPVTASKPTTPTTPTGPATTNGAGNTGNTNTAQTPQTDVGPWSNINNEAWGNVNPLAKTDITLPEDYAPITSSEQVKGVKLAHDSSAKQTNKDVVATENGSKVSSETKTESGKVSVPEYISLTTAQKHTYNYKCIGYSKQGYPVYTTPKQGTKNEGHIYILVKQGNDFVLLQCSEKFTGYSDPDKQNG